MYEVERAHLPLDLETVVLQLLDVRQNVPFGHRSVFPGKVIAVHDGLYVRGVHRGVPLLQHRNGVRKNRPLPG